MMTYNGEKIELLIERLRINRVSENLISQFDATLIKDYQGISGYVSTKDNYASVWEQIGFDLIEKESAEIGLKWLHSPNKD